MMCSKGRSYTQLTRMSTLFGMGGTSYSEYKWFECYFFSRIQRCFVNGSLSGSKSSSLGIPQGTILGPLCVKISFQLLVKVKSR